MGIEPSSPALQADSLPAEPLGKPSDYIKSSQSSLMRNQITQFFKWAEDLNTFLQRRYTDGQETHEKMLNIAHY